MKRSFFLAFIAIISLAACDPGVDYKQVVQNNSSHDVWVLVHSSFPHDSVNYPPNYKRDSFYVASRSEVVLYEISHIGQVTDHQDCDIHADSLTARIVSKSNYTLTKKLTNPANWQYNVLHEAWNKAGECECRFVILNEDIK